MLKRFFAPLAIVLAFAAYLVPAAANAAKDGFSHHVVFHLDEYLDIPETHKASFRKYLKERFIDIVGDLKEVYLIRAYENGEEEAVRMSGIIKQYPIDLALVGIGENGHLAFNDPPADFKSEDPYLVVELDEVCRRQQVSEGWFDFLEDVPRKAISMSIGQILKSASIICSVPERRKAEAVKNCLTGEVDRNYPSSVLQTHNNCTVYLDKDSSVLLSGDRIV